MKEFCDFFSESIYKGISHCVTEGNFIADIKEAEVCPPYKNEGRIDKSNCLAITILYDVSKIYERCLFSQLYHCFDKIFFKKFHCGFLKVFRTQRTILVMIEKMKNSCDNKEFRATILTDLLKAFDCVCHYLLIAKLNTYGFD